MRQVNMDELVNLLQYGLGRATRSQLKDLQHHDPNTRLRARLTVAAALADRMKRFEILTSAPPPPPIRYGAIDGVSGVPPIDEQ